MKLDFLQGEAHCEEECETFLPSSRRSRRSSGSALTSRNDDFKNELENPKRIQRAWIASGMENYASRVVFFPPKSWT